jgi:diguanylate cyclase (GGDEF)-like protein
LRGGCNGMQRHVFRPAMAYSEYIRQGGNMPRGRSSSSVSSSSFSADVLHDVLEVMPVGVALLDKDGKLLEQNADFSRHKIDLARLAQLLPLGHDEATINLRAQDGTVFHAALRHAGAGFCVVLNRPEHGVSHKDRLMTGMLKALHAGQDLYAAAALSLAASLEWRWIGITRFIGGSRVEVLAWWDTDRLSPLFSYDIVGTPCEQMIRRGGFCWFEEVISVFPDDKALKRMGAHWYAGTIYRGKDNLPVGHIYMFDDRPQVDMAAAEEALDLMTLMLGAELRLMQTEDMIEDAVLQARTDALTGLANRMAFDEDCNSLEQAHARGGVSDALLAMIDLDGMKAINDSRGHQAGDKMLQLFAEQLRVTSRAGDRFYRLGGDEFAMLFMNAGKDAESLLHRRLHRIVAQVRLDGFPEMDASVGLASVSEGGGKMEEVLRLADERMYADKQRHQTRGAD